MMAIHLFRMMSTTTDILQTSIKQKALKSQGFFVDLNIVYSTAYSPATVMRSIRIEPT